MKFFQNLKFLNDEVLSNDEVVPILLVKLRILRADYCVE